MKRTDLLLPLALMLLSMAACAYGLAGGSFLSLPYPDPPPPEVLAAARARERTGDIVALVGLLAFMASLLWIITRYRRSRTL
jgi:hypothetical protein